MNKKYIKIGAITLLSLGAVYGGYRLVRYLVKKSRRESMPTNEEVQVMDMSEKKEVAKPTFSGTKIVSKGSKGDEAKTVQTALNNIIGDAKKWKTPVVTKNVIPEFDWSSGLNSSYESSKQKPYLDIQLDSTKDAKRKKIASLKPLVVDGDFGSKSVAVLIEIMGKSSASYNEVRDKRISLANTYGLGNPYKK
jgi:hypothetical protein